MAKDLTDVLSALLEEHAELETKTSNLEKALKREEFMHELGEVQTSLLLAQFSAMTTYLAVLSLRIANLRSVLEAVKNGAVGDK